MPDPMYKIKEETVIIDHMSVRILRITNIDELFDLLAAKPSDSIEVKDERIPYWADLWPSAIALSKFIVENKGVNETSKVLEMGCGLGLPGVVAGMLGADVTFTDYIAEPLDFAKKNWELNNSRSASFEIIDWRNIPATIDADIILASDVAYEKRSFEYLLGFIRKMCDEGKTLLLSEPGRKFAEPFIREMDNASLVRSAVPYIIPLNNIDTKVTVYELRK
jgi:predicted nicotinamide N-methyase